MLRLRQFGRKVGGSVRGALARPFGAVATIFRPVGAAVSALAGTVGRFAGPLARPLRRITPSLGGFVRGVGGLLTSLLAGVGVFLVVAGLFYYFSPEPQPVATPGDVAIASASPAPYSLPPRTTPSPLPSGLSSPSAAPTAALAIATRVVIPALNIDVPVVASPPNELYPLCNVAEYLSLDKVYAYPGAPRATYIYSHARVRMFWNLLVNSKVNNGAAMIGMWVEVYTDDNQRHIYEISQVIRHVPPNTSFADKALAATSDELWLQTSEGHLNSSTKLQIVALPIGVVAATQAAAHPKNIGIVCPDAPFCTAPGQGGCRR